MSNYELTYILRPLEEANLTATNERITTIVKTAGGNIVARNDWGRRRLAYPIRKIHDGYYTTLYLNLPGSAVRGIERSLRLIDDVQRYLVVKVDELKVPATPAPSTAPIPGTTQPAAAQATAAPTTAQATPAPATAQPTAAPTTAQATAAPATAQTETAPVARTATPETTPAPTAETTPVPSPEPTKTEGS